MPTISDFVFQAGPTGTVSIAAVGTFVRLVDNVSLATFISSSPTNAAGQFIVTGVPAGNYALSTGPTAVGPWTLQEPNYFIGADVEAASNTFTGSVLIQGSGPWFDTRAFGADPTGATDSTNAIQAALNAQRSAGGGTVYSPPGTYIINIALRNTGISNSPVGCAYGGNLVFRGAGRDATIFKLVNNASGNTALSTTGASIFQVWNVNQEQVTFMDFTIDGNAANQTDTMHGLQMFRNRGIKLHRVRVKDVRGTTNSGGATETMCYLTPGCTDVTFVDCEAIQTAGSVSNGFGCTGSANVDYIDCKAINIGNGASIGFGFNVGTTGGASRQVTYTGCHAYLCGSQGFHIDSSNVKNVTYTNCVAGGTASDIVSGQQYPFTSGQSLGNLGPGFICTVAATAISYVNCVAENNTGNGWDLRNGEFFISNCISNGNTQSGYAFTSTPTVRMQGGSAKNNGIAGINIVGTGDGANLRIVNGLVLTGNTTTPVQRGGTNYGAPPTNVTAPGVPATTVALANPFGFDARVMVTPGASTCAVALDGVATGVTLASSGVGQMFVVPAGGTITLTYTAAPTWVWNLV